MRELHKLYVRYACREYLENWPELVKYCGYREDNIPQLQDVNTFLKRECRRQRRADNGRRKPEITVLPHSAIFRQNGIPVAARGRLPVPQGLPVRAGVPRVPLHAVHTPLVRPVLHARARLLPRTIGSHAVTGQSHVRAILARARAQLIGGQ